MKESFKNMKQTIDIYNNLDESQRHFSECKKLVSKSYLLYGSTYVLKNTIVMESTLAIAGGEMLEGI